MLESDKQFLKKFYPDLFLERNSPSTLSGVFPVYSKAYNKILDFYLVSIHYNNILPKVFEIGGRIPNNPDHHISGDGSCCLEFPLVMLLKREFNLSLESYIINFVNPFFANQTLLLNNEPAWFNGEHKHAKEGILQFYSDKFKTNKIDLIISTLVNIVTKESSDLSFNHLRKSNPFINLLFKANPKVHKILFFDLCTLAK